MRTFRIAVLAKASVVHLETVRYYERVGPLPEPTRTANGYLNYDHEHVKKLSLIRRARDIGFSIGAMREICSLSPNWAWPRAPGCKL